MPSWFGSTLTHQNVDVLAGLPELLRLALLVFDDEAVEVGLQLDLLVGGMKEGV